jgi:anti-sigma regulatory factor (Ser/Thr protein kinase)
VCNTVRTTVRCEPSAVRATRMWVSDQLGTLYTGSADDLVADAALTVSELVTNCVRADAHEVTVTLVAHRGDLVLAVTDDAPGLPSRVTATPGMTSGRGLQIVESITAEWGVDPAEGSKTVWGRFSLADGTLAGFDCDR